MIASVLGASAAQLKTFVSDVAPGAEQQTCCMLCRAGFAGAAGAYPFAGAGLAALCSASALLCISPALKCC